MKKNSRSKGDLEQSLGNGRWVLALAAVLIAVFAVSVLLFGPAMRARSVFSDALKAPKTSSGSVVIADPYVKGDPLPEAREVSLDGDVGMALVNGFLSAFESYRYVETSGISGMKMYPYFCVKSGRTAYFYLEEDSVWVEENSTFYRLRPSGEACEAAYAEFYHQVMGYLTAESE